jgi:hypothetical protein
MNYQEIYDSFAEKVNEMNLPLTQRSLVKATLINVLWNAQTEDREALARISRPSNPLVEGIMDDIRSINDTYRAGIKQGEQGEQ